MDALTSGLVRHDIVQDLINSGAGAVLRLADTDALLQTVDALRAGGITAIEITMTTPDALAAIERGNLDAAVTDNARTLRQRITDARG